eukprot:jgi/Ulvmu1/9936/UM058_0019.1
MLYPMQPETAAASRRQLSQVWRHEQLALAGCQRADVAVVAALALAESEGRRAKADAQSQWASVARAAAKHLPEIAAEVDGGEGMGEEEEAAWASVRVRLAGDAAAWTILCAHCSWSITGCGCSGTRDAALTTSGQGFLCRAFGQSGTRPAPPCSCTVAACCHSSSSACMYCYIEGLRSSAPSECTTRF